MYEVTYELRTSQHLTKVLDSYARTCHCCIVFRPPTQEANMTDHMKRDKREKHTYMPPPLSEAGRKRAVVNMPTDRIRKLLDIALDLEECYDYMIQLVATQAPQLLEQMPSKPDTKHLEGERVYQQVRGKYNEANRHRVRLSRMRNRAGLTLPKMSEEQREALLKEVEQELGLSGSIDNRSIGIVSHATDGSPQRSAAEIAAEMNSEPVPEPKVTIIETVIEPIPGLVEAAIKEDSDD